jgi:hypothetical protein
LFARGHRPEQSDSGSFSALELQQQANFDGGNHGQAIANKSDDDCGLHIRIQRRERTGERR